MEIRRETTKSAERADSEKMCKKKRKDKQRSTGNTRKRKYVVVRDR